MAKVWVVLQLREGQLPRISREAIAAAQKMAGALGGGKAEAVVLGSGVGLAAAEVAKGDLAAVHVADHEALRAYTPGGYVGALAPAIQAAKPDFVVFPHTYQTVD
jgi:electron transfer flavoprotein alpha subunit